MLLGELLPCVDNAKIPRFITERRYASAARVKALCLSVCLSVSTSQVGVLSKRPNGSNWLFGTEASLGFTYVLREFG